MSKNSKVLDSFVEYCNNHPDERFWQALRNWSGFPFIMATNWKAGIGNRSIHDYDFDTFYFEGKRQ